MINYVNNEVFGFYTVIGSDDYPKSWNPEKPFGFDDGSATPVYLNSYSSLVSSFSRPIETRRIEGDANNHFISALTIEDPTPDIADDVIIDLQSSFEWNQILKGLYKVFMERDTGITANEICDYVNNINDPEPANVVMEGMPGHLKTAIIEFDNGEDNPNISVPTDRIEYVKFEMTFLDEAPSDVKLIEVTIFMNPDQYIRKISKERIKVFLYRDTDPNFKISNTEFTNQIINEHLKIIQAGRYKYFTPFTTTRVDLESASPDYEQPDPDNEFEWPQVFYIYCIDKQLTRDECIPYVKQYIMANWGLNLNETGAAFHYPELFGEFRYTIIPVNNTPYLPGGDDNENPNVVSENALKSPIKLLRALSILDQAGFDSQKSNYQNAEIIYVGNHDTETENFAKNPFIVINESPSSLIAPVSDNMPVYAPSYSTKHIPLLDLINGRDFQAEPLTEEEKAAFLNRLVFLSYSVILYKICLKWNIDNNVANPADNVSVGYTVEQVQQMEEFIDHYQWVVHYVDNNPSKPVEKVTFHIDKSTYTLLPIDVLEVESPA